MQICLAYYLKKDTKENAKKIIIKKTIYLKKYLFDYQMNYSKLRRDNGRVFYWSSSWWVAAKRKIIIHQA
jgi:hypothetical protein